MFRKKALDPSKIKSEDIGRVIDKALDEENTSNRNEISKLLTFLVMFLLYIFLAVIIESYALRIMFTVLGLAILTMIFQTSVLPSLKKK